MLRIHPTLLLIIGLLGVALPAQEPYRPWLDEALLSRAAEIGVGRIVAQSTLPTRDRLLTFEISRKLKGAPADRVLVVGAGREILAFSELPKLLFLEARGDGYFQALIDFVDLPEKGGRERVDFLAGFLKLLAADDSVALERRVKRLALDHLPTDNIWIKRIVVRELRALASARPGIFDAQELIDLRDRDSSDLPPREQAILRETLQLIEEGKALAWTRGNLAFPDDETRRSFMADLARFERGGDIGDRLGFLDDAAEVFKLRFAPYLARCLDDPAPEVRRHAAHLLGELESGAGLARLEELALRSDDMETRRAAVVAIGKIAPMRSVPLLLRILDTVELQRDALVALVAINTAEAALAVKDFDERLRKRPGADPELRRFVTRVRGEDFGKKLAAERAARRKRWGR